MTKGKTMDRQREQDRIIRNIGVIATLHEGVEKAREQGNQKAVNAIEQVAHHFSLDVITSVSRLAPNES